MSVNILRFIPTDPLYVPSSAAQEQVYHLLNSLFPTGTVSIEVTEEICFIDPGANLERILCPDCRAIVSWEWWGEAMNRAYLDHHFQNLSIIMPCCQLQSSLNDLDYEGSAGFARFLLEIPSPDDDLTNEQVALCESLLGCSVRKIWTHY